MPKDSSTDPIMRTTQPNENKGEKRRARKLVIVVMAIVGVVIFIVYAAMIGLSATQG